MNKTVLELKDLNKFKIWQTNDENVIILNKYFLFIQIPKSSSTTVLHVCQNEKLTTKLPCYRHEGLLYLENFIDSKLPVYAVVRNPYTQIFSYFFHRLRYAEITLNNAITLKENFKNFVFAHVNNDHVRQYDYLKSIKGTRVHILKFEDNNVIDVLNAKFNLKFPNNKRVNDNEDKIYIESKRSIKDFFSDVGLVNLIKRERHHEFEEFGYSTDINDI